jgi:rhodanese-related sulfurtransferase
MRQEKTMAARLTSLFVAVLLCAAGVVPVVAADPAPAADSSMPVMTQFDLIARLQRKDPDVVVLDVRTPAEFAAGHVPGARNISHELLQSRIEELGDVRGKQVVVYCRSGRRSSLAGEVLRKAGFKRLAHLEGDYLAWESEQRPIERSAVK